MLGIHDHLKKCDDKVCREVLEALLSGYLSPAFGALSKREIDLLFYVALEKLGLVAESPTIYSLVQRLRVTRSRARGLLYDIALRHMDDAVLNEHVKQALKNPVIQRQGDLLALVIENPLELDHVRGILQELGYASDGSFSPNLVRLSPHAYAALVEYFLGDDARASMKKA
jgi:hypothetical protein